MPLPDEPSIYPYHADPAWACQSLLVFAPHPDDEVLGCGGLLAAMSRQQHPAHVVIVSDGGLGGDPLLREQESIAAAKLLDPTGVHKLHFWRLPDRRLQHCDDLQNRMQAAIAASAADCVLTPSPYEIHPDHRSVAVAATAAFAQCFDDDSAAQLAYYEIGHPLFANRLLDITPVLAAKRSAIACFASQLAQQAYSEQILGLNRFRAYTLGPAVSHAEAFQVLGAAQVRQGLSALLFAQTQQVLDRLGV